MVTESHGFISTAKSVLIPHGFRLQASGFRRVCLFYIRGDMTPIRISECRTAECKIIETSSTVFNDFLVVWYKNQLKTVGPALIILHSAV
jgi:hypothetical protein